MANTEHKMTEKESLELITSMINQAKENVNESGTLYLLWGWLILFCCIVQFVGVKFFNDPNVYLVWILTWVVLMGYRSCLLLDSFNHLCICST